ncbi:MAG: cysteine dioxygenase [Actinobacteria bacterium]|nr:cysteine dioxygenase [Actinomycetota bacterium]
MNPDLSAAPEIAQLAAGGTPHEPFGSKNGSNRLTTGSLAAVVRETAADPGRWWSRVRFDAERPVRTRLPAGPGFQLWLVTTPPGYRATREAAAPGSPAARPGSEVLTVLAGELAEHTVTADGDEIRPLRPNRVRVRGQGDRPRIVNPGACYAVSLHGWA